MSVTPALSEPQPTCNAIDVRDFRKIYDATLAADGISFSLPAGTVGALVGQLARQTYAESGSLDEVFFKVTEFEESRLRLPESS